MLLLSTRVIPVELRRDAAPECKVVLEPGARRTMSDEGLVRARRPPCRPRDLAAGRIGNVPFNVRRETTLRVDHEVVQAAPWNFVLDSATADEEPPEHPTLAEPEPLFAEPTKLRAVSRCLVGGCTFEPGTSFEAPGPSACWLLSEGHAKNA